MLSAEIWESFRSGVTHRAATSQPWWTPSSPLFLVSSILHPSSPFPWCCLSCLSGLVAQPQQIQLFPEPPGSLLTFLSLFLTIWEIHAAFQPFSSSAVSCLAPHCPWPWVQSILGAGLSMWSSPELCRVLFCERVSIRASNFPQVPLSVLDSVSFLLTASQLASLTLLQRQLCRCASILSAEGSVALELGAGVR